MPWHQQPKKDAAICEKPRGVESRQRSGGIRMGKPANGNALAQLARASMRKPSELKHLSSWRKRK